MKKRKVIMKISEGICAMSLLVMPIASQYCRSLFYQPSEPEGLNEFRQDKRKAHMRSGS